MRLLQQSLITGHGWDEMTELTLQWLEYLKLAGN